MKHLTGGTAQRPSWKLALMALIALAGSSAARAGESDLAIPPFTQAHFLGGINGHNLLLGGLLVCLGGILFGLWKYKSIRKLPVHQSMAEISELIYETCKTYLASQARFLAVLWAFIAVIMVIYFGLLRHLPMFEVGIIILFSIIGILGSFSVAWFGIRINTLANSRTAFASLMGRPYPTMDIPLEAGMSIGMLLISVELGLMLSILLFVPGHMAGPCFIGFAVGESLGAACLRIAGGIFTKIADIGADLMKIVFKIKEDDVRNPGVIADCVGDNAGDSVGPTADGFETYGVTGVALITFILLAVHDPLIQVQLLVWIFVMRIGMVLTSAVSYWVNGLWSRARFAASSKFDFETPLTTLVWITSLMSIGATYALSFLLIRNVGDGSLWVKLSTIISCGTLAGAVIPELVKAFTSTKSGHVREVVTASREGGASLNVLSGLVAGNFSAYWMGLVITGLMAAAWVVSTLGVAAIMDAPAIFAFGLVAFGFLGMGPVTIAVDSYGPVTDNAQSVYELSAIEGLPGISAEIQREYGFQPNFTDGKRYLEENDGAGNTFKATAKPVLIGTAVVGTTTLIFSIIKVLEGRFGLPQVTEGLSILNPLFLLGLITGGAVIFWFSGASIQAVSTGAYRAVEFIKNNIKLDAHSTRASVEDSRSVVAICTQYAQKGMFNIFLAIFFSTLAFACVNHFFFIGYLISIAIVGLYQAIFMANAGGAWDNAKKLVETDMNQKGTELHAAVVVGDTVGDPFKDTSSVALNPVIKFTTLFGLLAVELAITLNPMVSHVAAASFFLIAQVFVWRSFYAMRIPVLEEATAIGGHKANVPLPPHHIHARDFNPEPGEVTGSD
jgi:K(+)-stimulated pyrophosphate-energized sodium pump